MGIATQQSAGREAQEDFARMSIWGNDWYNEEVPFKLATVDQPDRGLRDLTWTQHNQSVLDAVLSHKPLRHFNNPDERYQPLLAGEIRVFELYPAASSAPFEGELHVVCIDLEYPVITNKYGISTEWPQSYGVSLIDKKLVWYTALSYWWGPHPPKFEETPLKTSHGTIKITTLLAAAMRRLRSTNESVFLWIDQICIDQENIAERNNQVKLMNKIYTAATNTVIWLGEEDGSDPQVALELLREARNRTHLMNVVSTDDFERLQLPPLDDRAWWTVRDLLRRAWFGRTWIIQEAILSHNARVQCGGTAVAWGDLAQWCYELSDSGLLTWLLANDSLDQKYSNTTATNMRLLVPTGANAIQAIQSHRNVFNGRLASMLDALVLARSADAKEKKDKVYGILGLVQSTIIVDYEDTTTYSQVYHAACVEVLADPTQIHALLSCVDVETSLRPTWVPDWSQPRITQDLGYSNRFSELYKAGWLPVASSPEPPVKFSDDKKIITLRGKIFDRVKSLSNVNQDPVFCVDPVKLATNDWAEYAAAAVNPHSQSVYAFPGDSIYNAFFQTLLAGRSHKGSGYSNPSKSIPNDEQSEIFSLILDSTTGLKPTLPGQTYTRRREDGHFTLASLVTTPGGRRRRPVQTLEDLRAALKATLYMRRFAVTEKGYFALVPKGSRMGDEVVIFAGSCVPFVVRRSQVVAGTDFGDTFELVGESYVHGIMKGEVVGMDEVAWCEVSLV